MQTTTTKGIVLREVKTREADKILTILTPEGVISASAKGARRPKNKLFSGTSLFCYSEWTLFEGRSMFQVNEATPLEVFFGVREDIVAVAVATYMAEMLQILSPTGSEAMALLQLMLNSLYVLAEKKQDAALVKAVFEMRSLADAGFMPDVVACDECGKYEDRMFRFGPHHGALLCEGCAQELGRVPNIDMAALSALRHIVLSEPKKIYQFLLKGNSLALLSHVAEEYTLCHLDYAPKSLAFLKTMMS